MDFRRDNEKSVYKIGLAIGYYFSYVLFFSMMYFVLTKTGFITRLWSVNYFIFIAIFLVLNLIYRLFKKLFKREATS